MVAQLPVIEGTVARVNGHGFQLEGRSGWLNVSRYAQPAPVLPPKGQRVAVSLDGAGFVRAVDRLSGSLPDVDAVAPAALPASPSGPPDKDTRIARMNALSTATAILASGYREVEPDAVLALAARLEGWVNR